MIDYQWPDAALNGSDSFLQNDTRRNIELHRKIEDFFSDLFGVHVLLMPSGRASISLLTKYFNTNRSQTVFAPKWTSHCVWDMITRFANPTIDCDENCNSIIAVHKWGSIEKLSKQYKAHIIEDSVDSIFIEHSTFFPNNGEFEIVSLPKIIGSYTGGLILVKNKINVDPLRSLITDNPELANHQSKLRFDYALHKKSGFLNWEDRENENSSLDTNALENIAGCLKNYRLNKESISKRLDSIARRSALEIDANRLPPVFCVEIDDRHRELDPRIMIRNKNFSGFLDRPDFKKVGLIPLHFRAADELFELCFQSLCKN